MEKPTKCPVVFDSFGIFEIVDARVLKLVDGGGVPAAHPNDDSNQICHNNPVCSNFACSTINTNCYVNAGCGDSFCI